MEDKNNTESRKDVVLEVKDLRTYFFTKRRVVKAVDGVNFYVRAGETLGIVGESGSGKSITALSLLRLVPKPAGRIVHGEVLLNGENILEKSESEMRRIRGRKISMILQDPQTSLNPVFTVGEQILEALKIHNRGHHPRTLFERVIDALRQVNIAAPERRIQDYPHQMSGGMKQRVVGAIAISCEPQIIIADEPTTSLDVTIQAQYLRLLQDIQEATGLSIIFITHDFGIVANMCDRVIVMYAGRIVEHGPVRAIFNHPSHPYTQALIHSVPKVEERVERLFSIPGQPPALWELPTGCRFASRCVYAEERCHTEYPPEFAGLSNAHRPSLRPDPENEHTANCWKLEDPTWEPTPYSELMASKNTSL